MEYNIYDDADDDERFRSRLLVLTPVQRQLSRVISRIIESSTESMHSSVRNFLDQAGVFLDLRSVEIEGLRGRYSSLNEFYQTMESLFQNWTRTWRSKDTDNALPCFWERFKSFMNNVSLPSDAAIGNDCSSIMDFSFDVEAKKASWTERRSEADIPFPDRQSLPDLSSVMRPDYPIGDGFDYRDSQPLIPILKQPRQGSSAGDASQMVTDGNDEICRLRRDSLPDDIARFVLRKAIAVEINGAGFHSVQSLTLDILLDVVIERLRNWVQRLKGF